MILIKTKPKFQECNCETAKADAFTETRLRELEHKDPESQPSIATALQENIEEIVRSKPDSQSLEAS